MKGIILAAGRGSRLGALTDDRPKCLVKLQGTPLLYWQLEALRGAGIRDILIVRGYLGDVISGDFQTVDNLRWRETNMVASLMCALEWLKKWPCIVSYADIIYPLEAVQKLILSESLLGVLYDTNWLELWSNRFDDPLIDAESFIMNNGLVTEIGRKHALLKDIQGQYMGLLRFTPESVAWFDGMLTNNQKLSDRLDMTGLLSLLISQEKPIVGIPWNGRWCEVDSQRDLQIAHEVFH